MTLAEIKGVYATASAGSIKATADLFRHFRAFLASSSTRMRDPFGWGDTDTLTKDQAQARLRWMVHVAILRKAGDAYDSSGRGYVDDPHSREMAQLNHRGAFPRYATGDAQRHLRQLAVRINQPRLIVRTCELGEWHGYLTVRLPRRFTHEGDE